MNTEAKQMAKYIIIDALKLAMSVTHFKSRAENYAAVKKMLTDNELTLSHNNTCNT